MTAALLRFQNLPMTLRMTVVGIVMLSVAGVFYGILHTAQQYKPLIIGALIVVALILVIGHLIKRASERRRAQQLGNVIAEGAAPATADAAERARADQMRLQFQKGLKTYANVGKDLYKLPWVLLAGEPGSGKTEALRHSGIKFPPGLHEPQQGVGGTLNMDWWFSNDAVMLDTAGRLMFTETREWNELLKQLNGARPACPVNGLLLFIPIDTLLTDSLEKIEQKAGRIAQQLEGIQRTLDVRFPVFVIISKSDLLAGFREFFDGLEAEVQHQMLGWSNPNPLDAPFQAEQIDEHLKTVRERLVRRRHALLLEPAEEASDRRDYVANLYAFPEQIGRVATRLKHYLETIFAVSEWSAKPVFLRGIYFTSSVQQGDPLDMAVAEALGIPVKTIPGRDMRQRAYFLRDLFVRKVFPERGLVTRAKNATKHYHHRKRLLIGSTLAAVALLAGLFYFSHRSLKESIKDHEVFYGQVAAAKERRAIPAVFEQEQYRGDQDVTGFAIPFRAVNKWTVVEVLEESTKLSANAPRPRGLLAWAARLPGLGGGPLDQEVQKAHDALVAAKVLRPTAERAQGRLEASPWPEGGAEALAQLIRLRDAHPPVDVSPLLALSPVEMPTADERLQTIGAGWHGNAHAATNDADLERTIDRWRDHWVSGSQGAQAFRDLASAINRVASDENELLKLAPEGDGNCDLAQWSTRLRAFEQEHNKLLPALAGFGDSNNVLDTVRSAAGRAKSSAERERDALAAAAANGPSEQIVNLAWTRIKAELTNALEEADAAITSHEELLAMGADGGLAVTDRLRAYQHADNPFDSSTEVVTLLSLSDWLNSLPASPREKSTMLSNTGRRLVECVYGAQRESQIRTVITTVLEHSLTSAADVQQLVAAGDSAARSVPQIPLSRLVGTQEDTWREEFDPDGAQRLLQGWQAVLDHSDDSPRRRQMQVALDDYKGEYCEYWTTNLPTLARVRRFETWSEFQTAIGGMHVRDVRLDEVYQLMHAALDAAKCADPTAKRAIDTLDPDVLVRLVGAWAALDRAPQRAITAILSMSESQFRNHYLVPAIVRRNDPVDYWHSLTVEGLRLLAKEAAGETEHARNRLASDWRVFPLCKTDDQNLVANAMSEVLRDINRLRPAWARADESNRGSQILRDGAGEFDPDIRKEIDRMRGADAVSGIDRARFERLESFAKDLERLVSIRPATGEINRRARERFTTLSIEVGGHSQDWTRVEGDPLEVPSCSGPISITGTIVAERHGPVKVEASESWAPLRAVSSRATHERDGRVWHLHVQVGDVPVVLEFRFEMDLREWPTCENWPIH